MTGSRKHREGQMVRLGQMRRTRRTMVWILLTAFLLPLTSLDQLASQAYAQRQEDLRQVAPQASSQGQVVRSAANASDYSDLFLASRLQTADEFAVSISKPEQLVQAAASVLPPTILDSRENRAFDYRWPKSTKAKVGTHKLTATSEAKYEYACAGLISMVGPDNVKPMLSVSLHVNLKVADNRPENYRAGLILNFREVRYRLNPIAGQAMHATLRCLDVQGGNSSRPRWLPSSAERCPQLPEARLDQLCADSSMFGPQSKHFSAIGTTLPALLPLQGRFFYTTGSNLSQQIYCAMHRANGPPQRISVFTFPIRLNHLASVFCPKTIHRKQPGYSTPDHASRALPSALNRLLIAYSLHTSFPVR